MDNFFLSWTMTPHKIADLLAKLWKGLNTIENVFHVLRYLLDDEAKSCNIVLTKLFDQFKRRLRVRRTLESIDIKLIDKTIESVSKRIDAVLASKGSRTIKILNEKLKALFFVSLVFLP